MFSLVFLCGLWFQINVFLRITSKRGDGYHDLASLFHVSLLSLLTLFS